MGLYDEEPCKGRQGENQRNLNSLSNQRSLNSISENALSRYLGGLIFNFSFAYVGGNYVDLVLRFLSVFATEQLYLNFLNAL